jgi:hypothetical protein
MAYPDGKYPAGLETTYVNPNVCRSFSLGATTTLQSLTGQVCSEVLIINKSSKDLYIYDGSFTQDDNRLLIADGESLTLRGVTNSDQISAKLASGTGTIYYRTQYYSNNPSR